MLDIHLCYRSRNPGLSRKHSEHRNMTQITELLKVVVPLGHHRTTSLINILLGIKDV